VPSFYVDKVIFGGNLTGDPELIDEGSDNQRARFGVAANRRIQTEDGYKEDPVFADVTAWGSRAEFIANNFDKGDRIFFIGRHNFRDWENDSGDRQTKLELVVEEVQPIENLEEKRSDQAEEIVDEFDEDEVEMEPEEASGVADI
jgi:single-strand DNA-binding protein